jgi:hypothetical protein
VNGVWTALRRPGPERVVIADDDVRWPLDVLRHAVGLLDCAEVVRPQNYFDPLPWHARWDTGRTLLNRAVAADWPGTLVLRRSVLIATGGYDGDALFENLELVRTVQAAGGRELRAIGLYVPRRPPTTRHFRSQRVRQAYDSIAQPGRQAAELAILPAAVLALARRRPGLLLVGAAATVGLAELGRRRAGGVAVFRPDAALWAPLWVGERAVCGWLAVAARLRGGVPYGGRRLSLAAHSVRWLRSRRTTAAGGVVCDGRPRRSCDAAASEAITQPEASVAVVQREGGGGSGPRQRPEGRRRADAGVWCRFRRAATWATVAVGGRIERGLLT